MIVGDTAEERKGLDALVRQSVTTTRARRAEIRAERERARFRLHLVHHRVALKNRIHAVLISFGHPVAVSDLFGRAGRERLERMALPEPWASSVTVSLELIDELEAEFGPVPAHIREQTRREWPDYEEE